MTGFVWQGLAAYYTDDERAFMRKLARCSPNEATVLHELKALLGAFTVAPEGEVFVYTWGNSERRQQLRGRRCVVEGSGRKRTVLARFLDNGEHVTTDRYALRKATR